MNVWFIALLLCVGGISSANLECVFTYYRQCKWHLLTIVEVRCVSGLPFFLLLSIVISPPLANLFPHTFLISRYDVTGSQFTGLVGLLSRSVYTSVIPPSYCVIGTIPFPPLWVGKGGTCFYACSVVPAHFSCWGRQGCWKCLLYVASLWDIGHNVYFPFYRIVLHLILGGGVEFLFPDMGCKGCFMLAVTVSKRLSVPIPPFLKIHCAADVLLGLITYDLGMINDIILIVAVVL